MHAAAESNGTNGHRNGIAVLERVKQVWAEADAAGERRPGRPALAAALGVKEHQVQKALTELRQQSTSEPASDTSGQPSEPDRVDRDQPTDAPVEQSAISPSTDTQQVDSSTGPRPWPLVLIGFAAAVAVWSGWVGLGAKCGFGIIAPLPGIADGFTINTAISLPISVEAYAAYALRVWLSTSRHSARTITFAKWSTVISLGIGVAAQAGYHLLEAFGYQRAPWLVVLLVSSVPVAMVGLASGLAKLVKDDRQAGGAR